MKTPIPFGKYYLLDRINVGGMAEVFKAKAFGLEGFERFVAVKRILSSIAEDKEFISMFIDEAKIAVQLNHANICQVFDLGKVDDAYFIAMEYVPGRDLRGIWDRCKQRMVDGAATMPVAQACFVMMKVCEGLDYAHNKKDSLGNDLHLVHRDVSPQNIIVSFEGEVKLIDFGIAKAVGKEQETKAGILKGKFGYMSPEQVRGLQVDRRSDVFAAGIVLYELLTGERLFVGETDFSTLEKVRNVEILPPSTYNRKIPEELEQIVMRALAREPEERYATANDLHDDLQAFMYTSGEFYSRKELATWMKRVFKAELDAELAAQEAFRNFKPDAAALGEARNKAAAKITAAIPVVRAPDGSLPSINLASAASLGAARAASSWTPGGGKDKQDKPDKGSRPAPAPAPAGVLAGAAALAQGPPSSSTARDIAPLESGRHDVESMTTVDGMGDGGKIADLRWEEEELETHVYDSPPVMEGMEGPEAPEAPYEDAPPPVEELPAGATTTKAAAAPVSEPEPVAPRTSTPLRSAAPQPLVAPSAPPVSFAPPLARALAVDDEPETNLAVSRSTPGSLREGIRPAAMAPGTTAVVEAPIRSARPEPAPTPSPAGEQKKSPLLWVGLAAGVLVLAGGAYLATAGGEGDLVLVSEQGGQLLINQQPVAVASWPARLPLKPGTYQLTVQKEGFVPWTETIDVRAKDRLARTVKLESVEARTGGFKLVSDPAGAKAFLDGQELNQLTPMQVRSVAPGPHQLELRLGARALKQTVTVEAGKQAELNLRFPPEVAVVTPPPEARPIDPKPEATPDKGSKPEATPDKGAKPERTDRADRGDKPERTDRADRGDKPRGDKPRGDRGDRPDKGSSEGAAATVSKPRGDEGFVRINSKPWTRIVVDGRDTGLNTPQLSLKLPAGSHQITLQNPQFNIKSSFSVTVRSGETLTVVKNLQENPED